MNINIKATNIELTDHISDHINNRLSSIGKFIKKGELTGQVEIGKTTNHHKQGDVFKAEFDLSLNGEQFFAISETDDLYGAIDAAKEEIVRLVTSRKDRKKTLFKRGAVSVKKMMKGISKRNPFTSKNE
ncbi:MAG: ribosome-associated translation inhibitor RaiA [Patescibacteria group bacterium]